MLKQTKSKKKQTKQQNNLVRVINKIGQSRKLSIALGISAILVFSGIGTYMVNRSSAAVTAASVCGSGYTLVHKEQLQFVNVTAPSYLRLLKNESAQKYCAVNLSAGSAYGVAKPMSVSIVIEKPSSGGQVLRSGGNDSGAYKYYAGPVYVSYAGMRGQVVAPYATMKYKYPTGSTVQYTAGFGNIIP